LTPGRAGGRIAGKHAVEDRCGGDRVAERGGRGAVFAMAGRLDLAIRVGLARRITKAA
jgi:hypothetical protein